MPLLDRQRAAVRLGAIRIGTKVATSNGSERPSKLETFRLTSPDKAKIEAAAAKYGGEVRPWTPGQGSAQQWEVITTTDRLAVRVPPGNPLRQDYELWAGRPVVRKRLCDGQVERMKNTPCLCPGDLLLRGEQAKGGQACKPVTRLAVILADLPGLGTWSYSSTGDSAADELFATALLLQRAEGKGVMLDATLRLEQRESRGSGELRRYGVVVLDVQASLAALESGEYQRTALAAGDAQRAQQAALPPAPVVERAAPLGPPVGAPKTVEALWDAAQAATEVVTITGLRRVAQEHDWLAEYVPGPDGVMEALDNALYERALALGAEPR